MQETSCYAINYLMKTLSGILKINFPKISLLDIGAMQTSEADRFKSLFKSNLIEVIGFEANINEYLKLQNKTNKKYFNYCFR